MPARQVVVNFFAGTGRNWECEAARENLKIATDFNVLLCSDAPSYDCQRCHSVLQGTEYLIEKRGISWEISSTVGIPQNKSVASGSADRRELVGISSGHSTW
jgi:hypothetical protein